MCCVLFFRSVLRPHARGLFQESVRRSTANFGYNPIYYTETVWPYEAHLARQMESLVFNSRVELLSSPQSIALAYNEPEPEWSLYELWASCLPVADNGQLTSAAEVIRSHMCYAFEQGVVFACTATQEAAMLVIEYWKDQLELVEHSHSRLLAAMQAASERVATAAGGNAGISDGDRVLAEAFAIMHDEH